MWIFRNDRFIVSFFVHSSEQLLLKCNVLHIINSSNNTKTVDIVWVSISHVPVEFYDRRAFVLWVCVLCLCQRKACQTNLCYAIQDFKRSLKTSLFIKYENCFASIIPIITMRRPRWLLIQFIAVYKPFDSFPPKWNGRHFGRRHLQTHYFKWKISNFDWNFTEICS